MRSSHFWRRILAASAAAFLVLGLAGSAQAAPAAGTTKHEGFTPRLVKANELIGMGVLNPQGERLGTIEDVVLQSGTDRVSYAVLSFGGVLGIGGKCFAIPWSALTYSTNNGNHLILDVSVARLKEAPGFARDRWPDTGDPQWARRINEFYGVQQISPTAAPFQNTFWSRRLRELIGTQVNNLNGKELGDIEDIVLDLHEGSLAYCIISLGGFHGLAEKLCAVPWSAVAILPNLHTARLDADQKTLETIAFTRGNFPDLGNLAVAGRIFDWFGRLPYWDVFGYGGTHDPLAAWQPGSTYNLKFDTTKVATYQGTISSVGTFRPGRGAADGLRLGLTTHDGRSLVLQVGPVSFVDQNGIAFHYGDRISVRGCSVPWGLSSVVLVSEIRVGERTFSVRDDLGRPLWHVGEGLRSAPAGGPAPESIVPTPEPIAP